MTTIIVIAIYFEHLLLNIASKIHCLNTQNDGKSHIEMGSKWLSKFPKSPSKKESWGSDLSHGFLEPGLSSFMWRVTMLSEDQAISLSLSGKLAPLDGI